MLAIAGGPVLSIRKDARSQLQLISFMVAHRLSDNHNDDDEDGQQNENAADCHRDHCTVTHDYKRMWMDGCLMRRDTELLIGTQRLLHDGW